ncbi:MAG: type II secretion system protein GspM [Pseudohongiellaceae bacterium]
MKTQEKKLLILLGVLAAVVLVLRVLPLLDAWYRQGQEDIALLQERVQRYEQLIADTAVWQERELQKQSETAEFAAWVFQGDNPSLLGPSVQRSLRQAVEQSGISVREMSVAKFARRGDWLVVTQDLSFTLEEANILPFLATLAAQRPRLFITAFTVAQNRRQFTGSLTVTAFSRYAAEATAGSDTP